LKASEVVDIISEYPEFIFQNKKDLLKRKVDLVKKHCKGSDVYMRNLIRRHPDLFLKSWASFEAKINYVSKNLGRVLHFEESFPLLLAFDYSTVIKPRCEILKEQ
jgi:hypothetical protein